MAQKNKTRQFQAQARVERAQSDAMGMERASRPAGRENQREKLMCRTAAAGQEALLTQLRYHLYAGPTAFILTE